MKPVILLFLLISCKLCFSQNLWRLDLEGKVIDRFTGSFIEDVQVELLKSNNRVYVTKTDQSGQFFLYTIKEGKYQLVFSKKDYFKKIIDIIIEGIEISTKFKNTKTSSNYTCQVEVSMYQFVEGINSNKMIEPIGSIFFVKEKNNFNYLVNHELENELRSINKKIQTLLIKQNQINKILPKSQVKEIYSPDPTSIESKLISYQQTKGERCTINTITIRSSSSTVEFKEIQHVWGLTCYKMNNKDISKESFEQYMHRYKFIKK